VRPKPIFYIRATILVFILPLIFFYLFYGSASVLWTALTAGRIEGSSGLLIRDSVGSSSSFMLPFTWIWQLTPIFGCIAFISSPKRYKFLATISLLLGLIVIFVFFLSGSRGTMIFVATPVLFFFFYYNWHRGFKFWLPASFLLIILIGIMELQVRFRGNLLEVIADPAKAARLQGLKSATTFDPTQSQRDNNMYLFCLMVKVILTNMLMKGSMIFLLCWLTLYRVVYGKTNLFLTEQRISPTNLLLFFLVRSQWVLRVYLFLLLATLTNGRFVWVIDLCYCLWTVFIILRWDNILCR